MASEERSGGRLARLLLAGLAAGGLAAVAAALLSLPLRSPDDVFLNSATVTVGALLIGVAAGLHLWWWGEGTAAVRTLRLTLAGLFAVVLAGSLLLDLTPSAPLAGLTRFAVPLAAVICLIVGLLTPLLARPALRPAWTGAVSVLLALGLGLALVGQRDGESGALRLPNLPAPAGGASARVPTVATIAPVAAGAGPGAGSASDAVLRPADVAGVVFTVVTGESQAKYTVRERLAGLPLPNDAVGRTDQVSGQMYLDGRPSKVTVDLRTLRSDQPRRDAFVRQNGPQLDRYPLAEFTVTSLDLPSEYRAGETVTRTVTGTLKLRETVREVSFAVEARLRDTTLQVLGKTAITWADFNIPPPNVAGMVQVEDTVNIEVLLIARREAA